MDDNRPRYANLRDYLGLLRRQRLAIALVAAAFAFAGLLISVAQSPTYTAQASISFRDPGQDLPLLGGEAVVAQPPAERAARNADLINGGALDRVVAEELEFEGPERELSESVTARVALQTNLVVVEAQAGDSRFAADLANAFADAAAARANLEERDRLSSGIDALRERLEGMDPTSAPAQQTLQQLAQLQGLREVTQSEVVGEASPPATPTSPRPVRNTLLGLLVGLAFGLLVAFTRDSLDRRIRNSGDAHDALGYPVLGKVGRTALGSAGVASNRERPVSPQDMESFRMLRTNLAFFQTERPLKAVLVTSGLPEEGKTTVAAALAGAAAVAGQRTLLVDCDLRRPKLATRLGIDESPGLVDYLAGRAKPAEVLQVRSLSADGRASGTQRVDHETAGTADAFEADAKMPGAEPTLVCIASGQPATDSAELLASQRCHDFLTKVSKAYDLVVIDSSPMLASVDPLELIPFVDGVLVCVRASQATREEARAVRHALERLPDRPTGIVVTGLRRADDDYGYYGYESGR